MVQRVRPFDERIAVVDRGTLPSVHRPGIGQRVVLCEEDLPVFLLTDAVNESEAGLTGHEFLIGFPLERRQLEPKPESWAAG